MDKFALPTILFLAMFQLCPSLFSDGAIFDVVMIDGQGQIIHGLYFDNVYNVMLYLLLSWLSISLPFFTKKLSRSMKALSLLSGAWWVAGCAFEVANFAEPWKVYNCPENRGTFGYCLFVFIIGLTLIIINKKWNKLAQ